MGGVCASSGGRKMALGLSQAHSPQPGVASGGVWTSSGGRKMGLGSIQAHPPLFGAALRGVWTSSGDRKMDLASIQALPPPPPWRGLWKSLDPLRRSAVGHRLESGAPPLYIWVQKKASNGVDDLISIPGSWIPHVFVRSPLHSLLGPYKLQ